MNNTIKQNHLATSLLHTAYMQPICPCCVSMWKHSKDITRGKIDTVCQRQHDKLKRSETQPTKGYRCSINKDQPCTLHAFFQVFLCNICPRHSSLYWDSDFTQSYSVTIKFKDDRFPHEASFTHGTVYVSCTYTLFSTEWASVNQM